MDHGQGSYSAENKSRHIVILIVILILVIGMVFTLISIFSSKSNSTTDVSNEVKSTAWEQTEKIGSLILRVHNLSDEVRLFDELFDELVYTESPKAERIGEFVSNYKNYSGLYKEDKNIYTLSKESGDHNDSSILSYNRQQELLESSINSLLNTIEDRKRIFMSIPVTYPIEKKEAIIVSGYGMRNHPILGEKRMHTGIDIRASVGTPVFATASGKVIETREQIGEGYGQPCVIEHKFGYQSLYGHLVRLEAFKDQIVQKGQIIGRVGETGLSQGSHLHYEVRKNGKPLNPSYFIFEGLTPEEYKEGVELGTQ